MSEKKQPKGIKGWKRKLREQKNVTAKQVNSALRMAEQAIDQLSAEVTALKRILIAERAQLIFYTDRCVAYAEKRCLDILVPNFLDLADEAREPYIKRAIVELSTDESIVPHDPQSQQQPTKRRSGGIIMPGEGAVN